MKSKLQQIAQVYLQEEMDFYALTEATKSYKQLLEQINPINLEELDHKSDICLDQGVAIGLTWAARCVDDLVRTKKFIKGIAAAIEHIKTLKSTPIHLVYAGTGPFATLILPLLSKYQPSELQLTLLEINETSLTNVKRIFNTLGFEDFIKKTACVDATIYRFDAPESIDIIVSETMQNALRRELQVPITANLIRQTPKTTIFIPQQINLHLAAIRSDSDLSKPKQVYPIGTLMEWNTEIARTCDLDNFPIHRFELEQEQLKNYHYLAILTDIQIFGEEHIQMDESGLTIPSILIDVERIPEKHTHIQLQYQFKDEPEMTFQLK